MAEEQKPTIRQAVRAGLPVPPGSPVIVPFVIVAVAATIVGALSGGYFLFFSFRGPPQPPKDNRLRIYYEQTQGDASVHDGYILLIGKADLYEHKELLAYLQGLLPLIVKSDNLLGGEHVHIPGDLRMDSVNWADTGHEQAGLLADGKTRVEIAPDTLAELQRRGDRLIELGASPDPPRPPHPINTPGLP